MARETPGEGAVNRAKSSQAKWEWAEVEVESTCLAIRQSASTGRGWMGGMGSTAA